jgi:hypothetical protein
MANAMYAKGLEAFLSGKINWESDAIKAVLIDTSLYTPDLNAHQYLSHVPLAARTAVSPVFQAKSTTNGVADAADVTFPSVVGAQSEALAIFKDTGDAETSPLICFIDTATGLPVTPGGSDISVVWDNGANKIFRL